MFELYKQTNDEPKNLLNAQQRTVTTVAESLWQKKFFCPRVKQTDPMPALLPAPVPAPLVPTFIKNKCRGKNKIHTLLVTLNGTKKCITFL